LWIDALLVLKFVLSSVLDGLFLSDTVTQIIRIVQSDHIIAVNSWHHLLKTLSLHIWLAVGGFAIVLVFTVETCQKSQFLLGSVKNWSFRLLFGFDSCRFEWVFGVERKESVIIADVAVNWLFDSFFEFGLLALEFIKAFEFWLDIDLFVGLDALDILADDLKDLDKGLADSSDSGNNCKIDTSGT
jgi:hypothetical protein